MRTGLFLAALLCVAAFQDSPPQEMKVNVAAAPVKAEPKIPAKTLAVVKEGDSVTTIGKDGAWNRIRWQEGVAYVPASAVSLPTHFIPSAKAGSGEGDKAEGTIAARGFNDEAERKIAEEQDLRAQFKVLDTLIETPAWKKSWESTQQAVQEFKKAHALGEFSGEGE